MNILCLLCARALLLAAQHSRVSVECGGDSVREKLHQQVWRNTQIMSFKVFRMR